eukprot:TRINITY_DN85210_c0_g1_i1.p2 TRINITY_DN85210_c0_g1~~TRINITY_DN85210_c0_g1_i1.p2  ORF type:complete len:144 (-),score=15.22 TRINITY_DN85210_c0_g1_i1:251-682(-)
MGCTCSKKTKTHPYSPNDQSGRGKAYQQDETEETCKNQAVTNDSAENQKNPTADNAPAQFQSIPQQPPKDSGPMKATVVNAQPGPVPTTTTQPQSNPGEAGKGQIQLRALSLVQRVQPAVAAQPNEPFYHLGLVYKVSDLTAT